MKTFKISVVGKGEKDYVKFTREIPYKKEKTLGDIKLELPQLFPELGFNILDFKVEKVKTKYKTVEVREILKEFGDPFNNYIGE
jgi:hypothetical protein